jgi:hypothetical protein
LLLLQVPCNLMFWLVLYDGTWSSSMIPLDWSTSQNVTLQGPTYQRNKITSGQYKQRERAQTQQSMESPAPVHCNTPTHIHQENPKKTQTRARKKIVWQHRHQVKQQRERLRAGRVTTQFDSALLLNTNRKKYWSDKLVQISATYSHSPHRTWWWRPRSLKHCFYFNTDMANHLIKFYRIYLLWKLQILHINSARIYFEMKVWVKVYVCFNGIYWVFLDLEMQIVNQLLAGILSATKHLSNVNTEDVLSKCFFLFSRQ